ncbi:MAG: site-specific integrase [candidate division NC10 bacterium]|nr:site-specific integrase [candidate division NC10 bacterium]
MARRGDGIYLRRRTWWLDFMHQGKRHYIRLGKNINRTAAGELARVQRAAILKGEAGIGRKRRDLPFEKAKEEFLAWAEANKRPKTMQGYRQCLKPLAQAFAGKRLGELHPFAIERYRRGRVEAGAPIASNRELAVLKALFNRCLEWGKYEGENPVRRVKLRKEPRRRLRYLEPEEEAALLAAAAEPLRTMILVGIHAGLRLRSEALTLRWADVDLRRRLLTVQAAYAKSGQTRSVNLNAPLRDALGRLRMQDGAGEFVFSRRDGSPYRSVRTAFATACRRAGLKEVTPHVLRHTFASRLAMAGVDLRTLQELGGWTELEMVQRYAHLSPSHKAEAVERIARANSPTLFTTPLPGVALSPRKAGVAQWQSS